MGKMIRAGLLTRMRQWMAAQGKPFFFGPMCEALGIPQGRPRIYVSHLMRKFIDRDEVQRIVPHICSSLAERDRILDGQILGSLYGYNHSWQPREAPIKMKILRAMRLISFGEPFSVADVKRMAAAGTTYVHLLTKELLERGYLIRVGTRACPHGAGRQSLYRVTDLMKFKIDLL